MSARLTVHLWFVAGQTPTEGPFPADVVDGKPIYQPINGQVCLPWIERLQPPAGVGEVVESFVVGTEEIDSHILTYDALVLDHVRRLILEEKIDPGQVFWHWYRPDQSEKPMTEYPEWPFLRGGFDANGMLTDLETGDPMWPNGMLDEHMALSREIIRLRIARTRKG